MNKVHEAMFGIHKSAPKNVNLIHFYIHVALENKKAFFLTFNMRFLGIYNNFKLVILPIQQEID